MNGSFFFKVGSAEIMIDVESINNVIFCPLH